MKPEEVKAHLQRLANEAKTGKAKAMQVKPSLPPATIKK